MYEVKSRVRLSEVSDNGCMTLPGIINSFQDASIFQSEDLGVGTKYLEEQKKAWVLSSGQVEILRYPNLEKKSVPAPGRPDSTDSSVTGTLS